MNISMHTMAVDTFVPMLDSLVAILDRGAAHAKSENLDLVNARLAPDMYTLAQQVQIACDEAKNAVARLMGEAPPQVENSEKTIADLKVRIASTLDYVKAASPGAFEGSEDRDCSIEIGGGGLVFVMNGLQYLRAWALPNFYFHVVTAYDILRHNGVQLGKQDYLSQVAAFIRPRT
jgi:hypothetical protein